ncbi:hypothetical protein [Campylobacter mucosalis]|uniref:Uncharacterized protein n=1 Tax=Campylobacter mucosalis CCUG 21559 TaxID=1032067 RepID=A0A6G5QFE4_9BACT|nr:hypothetical protein [Campylobacter mucosalis]QCD44433.1 hypothetical protein CMUC_0634 [Campylobacter mucosalis CCUG 21559]
MDYDFKSGIDSYRFIISKSVFLKFMRKLELNTNLRGIERNKSISDYAGYKFKNEKPLFMPKGNDFKMRYINFKRGNKSLTNAMIVIENSNTLNELCKKRKKPFGYYVYVVFAGLYQPSREVFKKTYGILGKFLRRFKTYTIDYAVDFKCDTQAGSSMKKFFANRLKRYSNNIISCKTTLYANECRSGRFYGLAKVCFYDKYEKQTAYHKQNLDESLKGWHRLELTFTLKSKFLNKIENQSYMEYVAVMDDIANLISDGACPFGVGIDVLMEQVNFFKDNRRALSFTKSA